MTHLVLSMRWRRSAIVVDWPRIRASGIALRWRWIVGIVHNRTKRLSVGTIYRWINWPSVSSLLHPAGVAEVRVRSMRWYKSVGLGGDWCEDAFLVKAKAVRASAVRRRVEAVAANLYSVSRSPSSRSTLFLPCVSGNNGRRLPYAALELVGCSSPAAVLGSGESSAPSRAPGRSVRNTCRSDCGGGRALVVGVIAEEVRLPCRLTGVVRRTVRTAKALGSFLAVAEVGTVLEKPVRSNVQNTELDLGLWTLAGGKRMWRLRSLCPSRLIREATILCE